MQLHFDPGTLRPLIQAVVAEALAQLEADRARVGGDKLCYSEAEAAALLSLHEHQLRDERRRGRVQASVGPGRKILYGKTDLLAYLASRRWTGNGAD
jgi:hypothetical protein